MTEDDLEHEEPTLITRRYKLGEAEPTVPFEQEAEDPEEEFRARLRRRRILRRVGAAFPVLVVLLLAGLLGARFWVRHRLVASLPQLDGTLAVPGLSAPVTVRRDARGVPHIQAATLDDLVLAQGYVTAQDRLWQMDVLRRNASGELAEVIGAALLPHDRAQRLLQMRTSADRAAAALPPDQRHWLEVYARGVNASIEAQRGHLPLEFALLRYAPAPWTPRDSILVGLNLFQELSTSFPEKLGREAVEGKLPAEMAADLYPVGSWRDHPPGQGVDLTKPVEEIEQIPLDETQSRVDGSRDWKEMAAGLAAIPGAARCEGCRAGSNNWAVSAAHTTTGKPMLSNDTHLAHSVPGIWYESDLQAPDGAGGEFHAAGVAIPGTPFIIIGHNAHVAWGFTVLGGDVQDLYAEHLRGAGPAIEYAAAGGAWRRVQHRTETIHVRNGKDVKVDVLLTRHGAMETPIITAMIPGERRALALRWTIYDPAIPTSPFFAVDSAKDWGTFSAAMAEFGGPSQNVVYADDQGHIAYHAVGKIPLRGEAGTDPAHPEPLTYGPVDSLAGDAGRHEWFGYIPFGAMPEVVDPANGLLATANARTTPDGYVLPITEDWAAPYRNERIWKLLGSKDRFSVDDMLRIETDVYSDLDHVIAQRLAYALDHAVDRVPGTGKARGAGEVKRLRQAADLLRRWNGEVTADSSAAPIVAAARAALWGLLLTPKLGAAALLYRWGEKPFAEEQMIMHTPARWLPAGYRDWDELLVRAVEVGLAQGHAPGDLSKWRSGAAHPVDVEHPLYEQSALLRALVGRPIGTGVRAQSGDTTTVKQVDRTFGPSERMTVDLADPDRSTLNVVLGQSGNPASEYFLDQFGSWLAGTTYAMPFSEGATAAATRHTLTLTPR